MTTNIFPVRPAYIQAELLRTDVDLDVEEARENARIESSAKWRGRISRSGVTAARLISLFREENDEKSPEA